MNTPLQSFLSTLHIEKKEQQVYISLVELGISCASSIAKKTNIPKSSVLFLLQKLNERGVIERSQRGNVQFFDANPNLLKTQVQKETENTISSLEKVIPLLKEKQNTKSIPPKIFFFEGIDACKNAYLKTLSSGKEILEFGDYPATKKTFGEKFLENFMHTRQEKNIFSKSIGRKDLQTTLVQKNDSQQIRETRFHNEQWGDLFSVVTLFDENKVLLLNPGEYPFAILIHNEEVFKTLKTIHSIIWNE